MVGQRFRGFVGQEMTGVRGRVPGYVASFPSGNYVWNCPAPGLYRFILWGAGGGISGGSGAYIEAVRAIGFGQAVSLAVAASTTGDGGSTTATFSSGEVLTAGGGTSSTMAGGIAVAGPTDFKLNGSPGQSGGNPANNGAGTGGGTGIGTNGGAGGPARLPYRGGDTGKTPAAGGAPVASALGGSGLILVLRDSN